MEVEGTLTCVRCNQLDSQQECRISGKPFDVTPIPAPKPPQIWPGHWHHMEKVLERLSDLNIPVSALEWIVNEQFFESRWWLSNLVFRTFTQSWVAHPLLTAAVVVGVYGYPPCSQLGLDADKVIQLADSIIDTCRHILHVAALQDVAEPTVPLKLLIEAMVAMYTTNTCLTPTGMQLMRVRLYDYGVMHRLISVVFAKFRLMEMDTITTPPFPNTYLDQISSLPVWNETLRRVAWNHLHVELMIYTNINQPLHYSFRDLLNLNVPTPNLLLHLPSPAFEAYMSANSPGSLSWIVLDRNDSRRKQGIERLQQWTGPYDNNLISIFSALTLLIMAGVTEIVMEQTSAISYPHGWHESHQLKTDPVQFWTDMLHDVFNALPSQFHTDIATTWQQSVLTWGAPTAMRYFINVMQLYDAKLRLNFWVPGMEAFADIGRLADRVDADCMTMLNERPPHKRTRKPGPILQFEDQAVGSLHLVRGVDLQPLVADVISLSRLFGILAHAARQDSRNPLGFAPFNVVVRTIFIHSALLATLRQMGQLQLAQDFSRDMKQSVDFLMEIFKHTRTIGAEVRDPPVWMKPILNGTLPTRELIAHFHTITSQDIAEGFNRVQNRE
jgi:hypothetical protein